MDLGGPAQARHGPGGAPAPFTALLFESLANVAGREPAEDPFQEQNGADDNEAAVGEPDDRRPAEQVGVVLRVQVGGCGYKGSLGDAARGVGDELKDSVGPAGR